MKRLFYLLLFGAVATGCNSSDPQPLDLIPAPAQIVQSGGSYRLPDCVTVSCSDSTLLRAGDFLTHALPAVKECRMAVGSEGELALAIDPSFEEGRYRLTVDGDGIRIVAGSYGGVISAIATLRQVAAAGDPQRIAAVEVEDAPRYAWRGYMLDVARHFFTKEEVKALLLRIAEYKFNKFHWHLTDDQGWRIEIRRYPELTANGGWRDPATHGNDRICARRAEEECDPAFELPADRLREVDGKELYGGFYTQEDIREVVDYAASLGIDVIPELDMPGHSLKIVESHPEFSCSGRADWGTTFSTPLCLGKDATLEFCKNVYAEVFELFPYEYAHLGADEVEMAFWKRCPRCQKRIRDGKLGDEHGLQAWFVHEMEGWFTAHGRKMIGWDEITGGELSQSAVVQWWRSWVGESLTKAFGNGNQVILSPSEFLYLDGKQDRNTLQKVYGFEPASGRVAGHEDQLLGLQANLWTETVPTFDRACYQIFPRLFAASELAWGATEKQPEEFERRVMTHLQRLDAEGWNYRIPDLGGFCDENVFIDPVSVEVHKPYGSISVRYTTDGSVPTVESPLYDGPIVINSDCTLKLRRFAANGKPGDTQVAHFVKSDFRDAVQPEGEVADGLQVRWHNYRGERCGEIERAELRSEQVVQQVGIPDGVSGNIGLIFEGYFDIPADGIYSFYLYSDDGSTLKIDGEMVVDNDGPHSRMERSGQAALRKGLHRVEIRYFDSNGGILELGMIDRDGTRVPLPQEMLKH